MRGGVFGRGVPVGKRCLFWGECLLVEKRVLFRRGVSSDGVSFGGGKLSGKRISSDEGEPNSHSEGAFSGVHDTIRF